MSVYGKVGEAANWCFLLHYCVAWKWLHIAISSRRAEKAAEDTSASAGSGFESEGAYHTRQELERKLPFSFLFLRAQRIDESLIRYFARCPSSRISISANTFSSLQPPPATPAQTLTKSQHLMEAVHFLAPLT